MSDILELTKGMEGESWLVCRADEIGIKKAAQSSMCCHGKASEVSQTPAESGLCTI